MAWRSSTGGASNHVFSSKSRVVAFVFLSIFRVVRSTGRGLVERLGKYRRMAMPGFNWILPGIDRMFLVNVTEVMVNADPQEIITSDKLNARVDAQVYFKVKSDEESVKKERLARTAPEAIFVGL
jgi:regulator of protease activity HflC (stomatin/prohibitin superfamily)